MGSFFQSHRLEFMRPPKSVVPKKVLFLGPLKAIEKIPARPPVILLMAEILRATVDRHIGSLSMFIPLFAWVSVPHPRWLVPDF